MSLSPDEPFARGDSEMILTILFSLLIRINDEFDFRLFR